MVLIYLLSYSWNIFLLLYSWCDLKPLETDGSLEKNPIEIPMSVAVAKYNGEWLIIKC